MILGPGVGAFCVMPHISRARTVFIPDRITAATGVYLLVPGRPVMVAQHGQNQPITTGRYHADIPGVRPDPIIGYRWRNKQGEYEISRLLVAADPRACLGFGRVRHS